MEFLGFDVSDCKLLLIFPARFCHYAKKYLGNDSFVQQNSLKNSLKIVDIFDFHLTLLRLLSSTQENNKNLCFPFLFEVIFKYFFLSVKLGQMYEIP